MQLTTTQPPWYKDRWPWLLAIMPITAVIAGFITLWLAIKSDDGLVADDYYKAGLAINRIVERDEAARRDDIHALVRLDASSVSLQLAGRLSARPDSLKLTLSHPTRKGLDHVILLTRKHLADYGGMVRDLIDARYDVILEPMDGTWRLAGQWRATHGELLELKPTRLAQR